MPTDRAVLGLGQVRSATIQPASMHRRSPALPAHQILPRRSVRIWRFILQSLEIML